MKIRGLYNKIKSILGLSLSLAKANFKLRNEGSYIGIFWYLLDPLLLFSIILFIQGVAFSNVKIEYYPIYLLFGIVINNLFSSTLGNSINSMNSNSSFLKSMKIDFEPFVLANIIQSSFSHLFEIFIICVFMIYFKISLIGIVYYFIVLLFFLVFLTGVSFLFATIGTYINDFSNIWKYLAQLLFFITPTFYVIKSSDPHYFINLFNPLFYFLTIFREVTIYHKIPEVWMMLNAFLFSIGSLAIGLIVFERFKNKFTENI